MCEHRNNHHKMVILPSAIVIAILGTIAIATHSAITIATVNRGGQYLHAHREKTTWDSKKLCVCLLILLAHSIFCHSAI